MTITSDTAYQVRPTVHYHVYNAENDSVNDLIEWAVSELGEFPSFWMDLDPDESQEYFWQDGDDVHTFRDGPSEGIIINDGDYLVIYPNGQSVVPESATDFHVSWSETA